jgi:hypothetical protein
MHYLYYEALEADRHIRITEEERQEQLVSRVYGNIHMEQPGVTKELVRELVLKYFGERKADASLVR